MRWLGKKGVRLFRGQRGFSLIEILVGVFLIGSIGIASINGMFTTYKGIEVSQEIVAAESLAKSQIESIKVQDYVYVADYDPNDPQNRYELIDIPANLAAAGYAIEIQPPQVVIEKALGFELQSITVAVKRDVQSKLSITIYRRSG